jgi:hypothetical protein
MDMAGNIRHCGNYFRAATCVRQSSEWEMRDLQGSFQQLKDHFLYEERGEQKIILHYGSWAESAPINFYAASQHQRHFNPLNQ